MNQYLVAWSCRGMCGTKLKIVVSWSSVLSCRMVSCRVVSHMCELSLCVNWPLYLKKGFQIISRDANLKNIFAKLHKKQLRFEILLKVIFD